MTFSLLFYFSSDSLCSLKPKDLIINKMKFLIKIYNFQIKEIKIEIKKITNSFFFLKQRWLNNARPKRGFIFLPLSILIPSFSNFINNKIKLFSQNQAPNKWQDFFYGMKTWYKVKQNNYQAWTLTNITYKEIKKKALLLTIMFSLKCYSENTATCFSFCFLI
jgi:hypothetical protein